MPNHTNYLWHYQNMLRKVFILKHIEFRDNQTLPNLGESDWYGGLVFCQAMQYTCEKSFTIFLHLDLTLGAQCNENLVALGRACEQAHLVSLVFL